MPKLTKMPATSPGNHRPRVDTARQVLAMSRYFAHQSTPSDGSIIRNLALRFIKETGLEGQFRQWYEALP